MPTVFHREPLALGTETAPIFQPSKTGPARASRPLAVGSIFAPQILIQDTPAIGNVNRLKVPGLPVGSVAGWRRGPALTGDIGSVVVNAFRRSAGSRIFTPSPGVLRNIVRPPLENLLDPGTSSRPYTSGSDDCRSASGSSVCRPAAGKA